MSIDYLDKSKSADFRHSKDDFFQYILELEKDIEQATDYGKKGDIRMLDVLRDMDSLQEDIKERATQSGEDVPPRDYHVEVVKILHTYIRPVLSNEIESIEQEVNQAGGNHSISLDRIYELERITDFYTEIYPELHLDGLDKKIHELARVAGGI